MFLLMPVTHTRSRVRWSRFTENLSAIHQESPNESAQQKGKSSTVLIPSENHQRITWFDVDFMHPSLRSCTSTITACAEDFLLYHLARRF
jgi:hypothetical protein